MLVVCLGDVLVDVIVEVEGGLVPDDDTPARITFTAGGQAANVATWVRALGGAARVFGPRSAAGSGSVAEQALAAHGVEVVGSTTGHTGAALSLVTGGTRSMASDPGDLGWLDEVRAGTWLEGAEWLFVSGYALLRSRNPRRLVETVAVARARGTLIAIDLSSAALVADYGPEAFSRLCTSLRPSAVFATDREWATSAGSFGAGGGTVLVIKRGSRGASFVIDGVADDRSPVPGEVVDATGAGDALAAGFLVGGVELAMEAAARCVARRGAQPPLP